MSTPKYWLLAQWSEQAAHNCPVLGSNPKEPTTQKRFEVVGLLQNGRRVNRGYRKRMSKRKLKRRHFDSDPYKLYHATPNYYEKDPVNEWNRKYWKVCSFSGMKRLCRKQTNRRIRRKTRENLMTDMEDISYSRAGYRKEFDYWWNIF